MNVVDSSGWLEFFADGPNADALLWGQIFIVDRKVGRSQNLNRTLITSDER